MNLTKEEIIQFNTDILSVLQNGYDEWQLEWNEEAGSIIISYQENTYIVRVDLDTEDMSPVLMVACLYFIPENFNQPLEQLNEFNSEYASVKAIFEKESNSIIFAVSTGIEIVPEEQTCAYVLWAIAQIQSVLNNAISVKRMLDCFNA